MNKNPMFLSQTQLIMTIQRTIKGSKAATVKKTVKSQKTTTVRKTTSVSETSSVSEKTIEHIQLAGQGIYDDGKYFRFEPEDSGFGVVMPFKGNGSIQLLSDGTLDVVRTIRKRSLSTLIKKLPHGRLSKTMDGAIQLTIKVFLNEKVKIGNVLLAETAQALNAYDVYETVNK